MDTVTVVSREGMRGGSSVEVVEMAPPSDDCDGVDTLRGPSKISEYYLGR